MGQRRSSEGAGYWQGVIGKQESSGMSAVAFCREHDVPESSFYNGKRKLKQRRREDDSTRIGKATSPGITRSGATRKNSAVTFVPLELPAPPAVRPTSCEVVLPDGCRVIVPSQCDPDWLREILQVVRELTPLTDLMRSLALQSPVVQADETPIKMLAPGTGHTSTTNLWAILGDKQHPYTTFSFTESRARAGPVKFFADVVGTLVSDAYIGYEFLHPHSLGRILLAGWQVQRTAFDSLIHQG